MLREVVVWVPKFDNNKTTAIAGLLRPLSCTRDPPMVLHSSSNLLNTVNICDVSILRIC